MATLAGCDSITSAICHLAYNLCEAATIDGQQMRHNATAGTMRGSFLIAAATVAAAAAFVVAVF